ncbi:MAG: hypothetical protein A3H70_03860 [Candidatus Komeilibacteria bacterium RIFCSPLOWO2_02_FULL_48_11]|uniref:Methyltransferase type 11 domain-containing protein n=1 Tax=Candidatus Komeilibacteria bacterium RIFCSPLOWO2_02_FULL_48_11 TaxID=1798553 RepID=A0A1G2BQI7_9BACT|nr:MAG: hypothetical protein A3H70_03860 [Candidatus Komeilibacteria bacterium RIFCSPLOWO2_02_FULL_48_11]
MFKVIIKEIFKGKTLIRTLMNLELKKYTLSGRVLDIGGGENPSYLRFFKKSSDLQFTGIDLKSSAGSSCLDLEKDKLPFAGSSVDQVLLFNILEHIYNHKFLAAEVCRVLKPSGIVIGFTPFLVNVHPDPHDYFRYTKESLERIFKESGFSQVEIKGIGRGPFAVSYNTLICLFPGLVRLVLLPWYWLGDSLLLGLKPKLKEKFPLGYLFVLKK